MASGPMNQVVHQLRDMILRDGVEPTDGQLLERFVKDREAAALEALVRRHGSMVWGVCRRVLANHHDAEDAFQATFLVLVRKASSVKPRDMVGNWLYGVAQQTALKARARSAKRKTREQQVSAMPEPTAPSDRADNLAPFLDQELSRLPGKYRAVLVLCELEGKTIKEAAKQLGVPDGTIASRLARGRAMLAKRLARHNLAISGAALPAILAQQAQAAAPPAVLAAAVNATLLVAAGKAAGILSIPVASLTEEVVKAMLLTKLRKMSAVVLLVIASGALGYGIYSRVDAGPGDGASHAGEKNLEPRSKIFPASEDDKPKPENQQPPEIAGAKLNILDMRQRLLKDEDLAKLPEDIDGLLLRGFAGYGTNTVTDEGIKQLTRFKRLRILAAGGLGLTDRALEIVGQLTLLEELSLDSNVITGKGLHHLASLKKLRKLNLNFNKLDPTALAFVAQLPELTSLSIIGA